MGHRIEVLTKGSVKDLKILKPAYENRVGEGDFVFSGRYSIRDWGEMPNIIHCKGRALACMAALNFEGLEKIGVRTHYKGLVVDGELVRFSDLKEGHDGSNIMRVDMARVYKPIARKFVDKDGKPRVEYDYSFFDKNQGQINNYLVGLEIIFRNGLPKGSSVFKNIAKAKAIEDPIKREQALQNIYQKLGINSEPKPGDMLPKPVIGYTTKLEEGDRKLNPYQAREICGLTLPHFDEIESLALKVDDFITEQTERAGMVHWDGKIELVWNDGLVVCDVLGTFDENRFSFNGEQVSKEVLRQWYDRNQPDFGKACAEYKKTGEGWQERCPVKPVKLPYELSSLVSLMYLAGCNQYTGKRIFAVRELGKIMEELRAFG